MGPRGNRGQPQEPQGSADEVKAMTIPQTHADRVARSLRRLGFRMTRVGRTFTVIGDDGNIAPGSSAAMSLGEIEAWIGERIKAGRT